MNAPSSPTVPSATVIDMHTHSTASDGTLSPASLVEHAVQAGISILALTDHDTTDGVPEANRAADAKRVMLIPGIELSTDCRMCKAHLLGLGITRESPALTSLLSTIREGRRERNHRIVRKLNLLGYPITFEDVAAEAGGDIIGRPHIARTLVKKQYFPTMQQCFAELLDRNGAAYVQRWRPDVQVAVDAIHDAGGLAVLAHPGLLHLDPDSEYHRFIESMKDIGLDGIESNYPMHSMEQLSFFADLAETFGLLQTGGSDFHGLNKEAVTLGIGTGHRPIGYEYAASVLARLVLRQEYIASPVQSLSPGNP